MEISVPRLQQMVKKVRLNNRGDWREISWMGADGDTYLCDTYMVDTDAFYPEEEE